MWPVYPFVTVEFAFTVFINPSAGPAKVRDRSIPACFKAYEIASAGVLFDGAQIIVARIGGEAAMAFPWRPTDLC